MYIDIKFFKESGKLSHEETILGNTMSDVPNVFDTDRIESIITEKLNPQMDHMWEATDLNGYNCRLVKI